MLKFNAPDDLFSKDKIFLSSLDNALTKGFFRFSSSCFVG